VDPSERFRTDIPTFLFARCISQGHALAQCYTSAVAKLTRNDSSVVSTLPGFRNLETNSVPDMASITVCSTHQKDSRTKNGSDFWFGSFCSTKIGW